MPNKTICGDSDCRWRGDASDMLFAPNPFDPTGDALEGCPDCLGVNTIVTACDEPNCWKETTCGTPTRDGYRLTCGEHQP